MSTRIPNSKSAITEKNIEKATNFLATANGASRKTEVKGAIAFLTKALDKKIGPEGPRGALAPLVPIIHRSITNGEKALASSAVDALEKKTAPSPFRNLAMPSTVAADTKDETISGRVAFQIKRRDGQNFVYTKPAPVMMRATRGLRAGMAVTDNRAGGKNLRFGDGKDIVGARWERASLDHILPKTDPRRPKLEAAGFDLSEERQLLVIVGEGDKHPTVVMEGAGYPTSDNGARLGRMFLQERTGVTVLCTEVQFVPFKADDPAGGGQIMMRKPVVYLYPQAVQDVTVKVSVDGEFVAQYPKMKVHNSNTGIWNVKAGPTGEIFDPATERRFPYLFWEASRKMPMTIDPSQAFCVKHTDAERFLEDAARSYALNDRERTDFVTYWLPALERNPYSLVQFLTGAEYDKYAEMTVTPKPDTTNRLFMVFQRVNAAVKVGSPALPQLDRKGFTVVEWGGTNLDETV